MRPAYRALKPRGHDVRPRWSDVLRALREARGVTQDGWAAQVGVSRKTVQRWEAGERAPDPGAEAAILSYCRERDLFRSFAQGPLAGLALTAERLQDLLAEARWRVGGGQLEAGSAEDAVPADQTAAAPYGAPRTRSLRSRQASRSNLPASLTSFIGREREIAELRRLQASTRLLTLTGIGGCGKTRLATALADELLWAYPNGVWLVELAALADPALVPQMVAAALTVQVTELQPPLEAVKQFLRSRSLLLVLDNCEHLLAECAELVETLLRACPNLEVLTTSREPLGISGEAVWQVPPLAVPGPEALAIEQVDAVRLFVERRRLQRPGFELTPQNAGAVADLCRRLDGIPLAIELAARMKVLSTEQMAARLGDRFQLLTGGSRTAPPRHQTLRAALDWSHDLLTTPEQALLRRLSVFAGGFTLEAAEAVCTGAPADGRSAVIDTADVLVLLAHLVDKSLVIADERGGLVRYRMLETLREYAAERLAGAGEARTTREAHAAWCLALAEAAEAEMYGPQAVEWLIRLELEDDNLRAGLGWSLTQGKQERETALRLAAALVRFCKSHGHLSEGRPFLAQVLEVDEDTPAAGRAKAVRKATSSRHTRSSSKA